MLMSRLRETLKSLKTLFKKDRTFKQGSIYCVLRGIYSGEYFVFMERIDSNYIFLSIPDKEIRNIPESSFVSGISNGILDFIENLPAPVFNPLQVYYRSINKINGNCHTKENN
jgi:hypothetical protein